MRLRWRLSSSVSWEDYSDNPESTTFATCGGDLFAPTEMAIVNDGDSLNSRHLLNHVPGLVLRLAWWWPSEYRDFFTRRKYAISRLHIPNAPS